ncbi:hypothetical protein [Rhodococcus sp. PvR099]|uniref:hypothetical protein n=1 Tax=Rhodococcus sp. PvR099 TaxID=2806602 RepID=UPI001B561915|nr:hypothetical protein [Rhodococcus sp. PvR099]MBP1159793.1 hypothetical protein [Rhodococcus sp. PvR099]
MTLVDADPETYYAAGTRCNDAAVSLYTAFTTAVQSLQHCGGMAGTFDSGREWATSYDERAQLILAGRDDAVRALENYGAVLRQAGHNHAMADHNANVDGGAPPSPPPLPSVLPGCTPALPPSAGGPGNGLVDGGLGLASEVGIPVPDGDTEKLNEASTVWSTLANSAETTDAAAALQATMDLFVDVTSPEVEFIYDDLEELQSAVEGLQDACREMAESCSEYKVGVEELRQNLSNLLEDLAVELAVTATIAVAASFVSFGISAAAGAAKSAQTITKFGRIVRDAVIAWKAAKNVGRGVKAGNDLRGLRLVLERIKTLGKKIIDKAKLKPTKKDIGDLFQNGNKPKASELEDYARSEGWTKMQAADGPAKYVDENGVVRLTIKKGSSRAPGSEDPHVELRDPTGLRIDPFGNPVTRKSLGNHTPIEWDLP